MLYRNRIRRAVDGAPRPGTTGPARLAGMNPIRPTLTMVAAAYLVVALLLAAQQSNLKSNYDTKSGLITPALESEIDVQVVTTDSVPGKQCRAIPGLDGYFPLMVLPTSGALGNRPLADGAIRGMETLREAAVKAGANAVRARTAQQPLHHAQQQPSDVPLRHLGRVRIGSHA